MTFLRLKTKLRSTSYNNRLNLLILFYLIQKKEVKISISKIANEFITRLDKEATYFDRSFIILELVLCSIVRKISSKTEWDLLELFVKYYCLDKNYNIFQTTRFNHTMIFFKLIDQYRLSDIYISHNNCLAHMSVTQLL